MRKRIRIVAGMVCAVLALSVTASAYYIKYVEGSHKVILTGIQAYSDIELNGVGTVTELATQASVMDDDLNSYGFGVETVENPTEATLRAAAYAPRSKLTNGATYYIQAYGHFKYMTRYGESDPVWETDDSDRFVYWRSDASSSLEMMDAQGSMSDHSPELDSQYSEIRAEHIFGTFDMSAEQYAFAWDFALLDYVGASDYAAILESMDIQPGTTTPSFFIDDDTIFGVCQDMDAVNYLYEFTRSADGAWELTDTQQLQDIGRYQDICQSFCEYQAAVVAASES